MDELSKALERMSGLLRAREENESISSTPAHGSMLADGKPNEKTFSPFQSIGQAAQQVVLRSQSAPSGKSPEPTYSKKSGAESFSPEERSQLAVALMQVCQMQHEYGKKGEDFETMLKGFLWILDDYPMPTILNALKTYVRTRTDIPAPADLVKIIDPPQEPLSAAAYVGLKKRIADGYYPLSDERRFLRAFEEQEYAKVRGGTPELHDAQRQIESHSSARLEYAGEEA